MQFVWALTSMLILHSPLDVKQHFDECHANKYILIYVMLLFTFSEKKRQNSLSRSFGSTNDFLIEEFDHGSD